MIVSRIESIGKKKNKVYLEEEFSFLLYDNEIYKFHLVQDEECSDDLYQNIQKTVLLRAKKKAMSLLQRMDQTEGELRQKLKRAFYTEDVIEQTIEYLNGYHYINDEGYTERYLQMVLHTKSLREAIRHLQNKGISKELILQKCAQMQWDDQTALERELRKKLKGKMQLTEEEKKKLAQSLCRKGFSWKDVRKRLNIC